MIKLLNIKAMCIVNYALMHSKIKEKGSNLNKLEKSAENLYNNGLLTVNEFKKLDSIIIDTKIKRDEN